MLGDFNLQIDFNMSLTVLVTGATGLLGREVLKAFKRGGWITIGQGYTRANPPTILKANLEDSKDIENLLNKTRLVPSLSPLSHYLASVWVW